MKNLLGLCLLLLIEFSPHVVGGEELNNNASWYKRYPAYPPYCSIPEEMNSRSIPPLASDSRLGDSRLVHVTAIIRHGARTPWGPLQCWDGYRDNPETSVWNCDLTTFLAPPSPREIQIESSGAIYTANENGAGSDAMFLFEKKYDALTYPQYNLHNELNGTCQKGQLILRGFQQEIRNGQFLRNAYLYDGSSNPIQHDVRMRLLDWSDPNVRPYQEPTLSYRSDDDQRTLMSGQILLRGLFGTEFVKHLEEHGTQPIIPLHTADRSQDILDPAEQLCPRLTELREEAETTVEYQQWNESQEAAVLRKFMQEQLGSVMEEDAIDCLMTTMCTDRKLPDSINDYKKQEQLVVEPNNDGAGDDAGGDTNSSDAGGTRRLHAGHNDYGTNLFQRILDFYVYRYSIPVRQNDAAYSKLAMGPLWAEILDNIRPIVHSAQYATQYHRSPPTNKLAVFSGHDTTIMPLLATLGSDVWDGTEWTPYASMMILEIHELVDGKSESSVFRSNFAFRLLYNGKVLTSRMNGCPDDLDLCDANVLMNRVTPFAKRNRKCDALQDNKPPLVFQEAAKLVSAPGGVLMVVLVVVASTFLGVVGTFVYLTGSLPWWCGGRDRRGRFFVEEAEQAGLALHEEVDSSRYQDSPVADTGKAAAIALT